MKSIDDLLITLRDLTYDDKIRWDSEDVMPDCFVTRLSNHGVRIFQWTDEDDGTSGVTAQLFTGGGFANVIDSTSANQFGSKYSALLDVYIAARRSAKNVSLTIENLQAELNKLKRL